MGFILKYLKEEARNYYMLFIILFKKPRTVLKFLKTEDAQSVTIFKKGYRRLCGNYKGMSLLSFRRKVFARILLNQLLTNSVFSAQKSVHGIGRPRLRYIGTAKKNLKDTRILIGSWALLSRNRCQQRDMVDKKSYLDTKDSQG